MTSSQGARVAGGTSCGNGSNIPAAIRHLAEAGYPVRRVAEDLGVARSTVYRWRAGRYQPNARNLAALRELTDAYYSVEVHRVRLTVASLHLRQAAEALEDPAERAEFEARMRAKHAVIMQRRARFEQRRDGRRVARQHRPVTSIAARITDPFALVGEPEPALPF